MDNAIDKIIDNSPLGALIVICFYLLIKTFPLIFALKERILMLEVKEKERNMELQELKKSMKETIIEINAKIEASIKRTDEVVNKIYERIEAIRS